MKTIKNQLKVVAIFLSAILLFQSCVANYSGSYTLMEAYNSKRATRITTVNNDKFEYSKIDTLNGQFVGQKYTSDNQLVNEPFSTKAITKIELKRTKESSSKEGLIILGAIVGVVLVIVALTSAAKGIDIYGD